MATKKDGGCPPSHSPSCSHGANSRPAPTELSLIPTAPYQPRRKAAAAARTRCTNNLLAKGDTDSYGNVRGSVRLLRIPLATVRHHRDEGRKSARELQMHRSSKTLMRTDLRARRRKIVADYSRNFPCSRKESLQWWNFPISTANPSATLVGTSMDSGCLMGSIS